MKPDQLPKIISVIELKIANFRDGIARRRIDNNFVMVHIPKELDFFWNMIKEVRTVVSGFTRPILMTNGNKKEMS